MEPTKTNVELITQQKEVRHKSAKREIKPLIR
jgi:hypothetical protein